MLRRPRGQPGSYRGHHVNVAPSRCYRHRPVSWLRVVARSCGQPALFSGGRVSTSPMICTPTASPRSSGGCWRCRRQTGSFMSSMWVPTSAAGPLRCSPPRSGVADQATLTCMLSSRRRTDDLDLDAGRCFRGMRPRDWDVLRGRNRPIVVAWAQGLAAVFTVAMLLALLPYWGVWCCDRIYGRLWHRARRHAVGCLALAQSD